VVDLADLAVQRPHVVEDSQGQQASGQQINESRDPFSNVETMDPEPTEECQQNPDDGIVQSTCDVAEIRLTIHPRDQEQIDQPSDAPHNPPVKNQIVPEMGWPW